MNATPSLASLIERAQRNDPQAFEALVDLYASRLYGFLYRLTGQREDAEDLVQEVFVRLVRTIDRYQHDGRFEAWLFRIATNLARDRLRRVRRSIGTTSWEALSADSEHGGRAASGARMEDPSSPAPDRSINLEEDVDRLQHVLAKLPAAEREVILLRHYTQMSFAEIARTMGTPLGTALARSHRGLAKLRRMMEES